MKTISLELAQRIADKYERLGSEEAPESEWCWIDFQSGAALFQSSIQKLCGMKSVKSYTTDELLEILVRHESGGLDLAYGEHGDVGDGIFRCHVEMGGFITIPNKSPTEALGMMLERVLNERI